MRRFLFMALIMFVVTGGVLAYSGNPGGPGNLVPSEPYLPLYRAMDMADACVYKGELHYWAALSGGGLPLAEQMLAARADALIGRLAPQFVSPAAAKATPPVGHVNAAPAATILVEREGEPYPAAWMRLLLQGREEAGEQIVHLYILIREEGRAQRLATLAHRFPALLGEDTPDHSLTLSLTGRIPQSLDGAQAEELARIIAGRLGTEQVECIREEFMVSLTGHTPALTYVPGSETWPVNFNLALRYGEEENGTLIWVGTPLISGMY